MTQPSFSVFYRSTFVGPQRPIFFLGNVLIDRSQSAAIKRANDELEMLQEDRHVFWTDASLLDVAAGVGVYWMERQQGESWSWMASGLSVDGHVDGNEAEMIGVLEALRQAIQLRQRRNGRRASTIIYTDSQSVLQSLQRFPFNRGSRSNDLLYEIIELTNRLAVNAADLPSFIWVKGHKHVLGNALADDLAGAITASVVRRIGQSVQGPLNREEARWNAAIENMQAAIRNQLNWAGPPLGCPPMRN